MSTAYSKVTPPSLHLSTRPVADLDDVRLGSVVRSVKNSDHDRVLVETTSGVEAFDAVVMATHADVTLKILGSSATSTEQRILRSIPYQDNDVYLHTGRPVFSLD